MDRKNPTDLSASNAWTMTVPLFFAAGADFVAAMNGEAQRTLLSVLSAGQSSGMRGTVPNHTDLGYVWKPGLYYLNANGNYSSFPPGANPAAAYFLEVGNPGVATGSDEGGGNRFTSKLSALSACWVAAQDAFTEKYFHAVRIAIIRQIRRVQIAGRQLFHLRRRPCSLAPMPFLVTQ